MVHILYRCMLKTACFFKHVIFCTRLHEIVVYFYCMEVISWGGWGVICWWGNDSLCILQQCIRITEDWWNCCMFIDFYVLQPWIVRPMTVQCVYLWLNYSGRLYNLNEEINMKYTVSFLLNTHRVIWLSYKMYTREANPTKVEKMKTTSIMKNGIWFRS